MAKKKGSKSGINRGKKYIEQTNLDIRKEKDQDIISDYEVRRIFEG